MTAAVRRGGSGTGAVHRAVRSQAKKALASLTEVWPPSDEAIHDARKRIKRVRASLRLVRDELGERAYRRENAKFRNAARPLSEMRDAKILVDALDGLARRDRSLDRKAVARLRSVLVARSMRARRRVAGTRRALRPVISALRSGGRRLPKPHGDGWSSLGPGIRRVYRDARRAAEVAGRSPTDVSLHEARKQAKYLWHQLAMLAPIRPAVVGKRADLAHRFSDRLGDDHDLAVLRQKVRPTRGLSPAFIERLRASIARRRRTLQKQAHQLARQLYRERPRMFEGRMRRYWRAWRSG